MNVLLYFVHCIFGTGICCWLLLALYCHNIIIIIMIIYYGCIAGTNTRAFVFVHYFPCYNIYVYPYINIIIVIINIIFLVHRDAHCVCFACLCTTVYIINIYSMGIYYIIFICAFSLLFCLLHSLGMNRYSRSSYADGAQNRIYIYTCRLSCCLDGSFFQHI